MRQATDRAGRFVVGLALLVLLLTAFVRDLRQFPRSFSWPAAQAEVIETSITIEDDFSVDFTYAYTVDGVTYEGSRITFFQYAVFANRFQNEQLVAQHPPGTPVQIYYDPSDPAQSVLMRTIPLSQLWSPVLLALCLLSVLLTGLVGWLFRGVLGRIRTGVWGPVGQ
ncbi:MAG TPA: DUF3592 domain-containing protein [Candidatus Sulfomarinibacteraceae bacterium]|nr:DUF3592 domain-containing protein [Candidatus Sulfomarinibacteraceae bacterium]